MKPANYRISLDILESQSQYSLTMKKGETSREIHITLREGVVPYEIGKDCFAVFSGRKPDGNPLENNCVIKENTIIYAITEQTTSVSGLVDCEIKLYGANNGFICSARFSIIVDERAVGDNEIESTPEFSALTKLYSEALPTIKAAEDASKKANDIADTLQTKLDNGDFKGEKGDTPAIDQVYDPTSENAQSGIAVAEGIKELYDANIDVGQLIEGEYVDYNGNIAKSAGNHRTDYVSVKAGYTVKFENLKLQGLRSVCVYDENKKFIKVIANGTTEKTATVVIPDGACYFIASVYSDETQYAKYIDPIAKDIADVKNATKDVNGIKYITEPVEFESLDFGFYFIDSESGGCVWSSNIMFDQLTSGYEIYNGFIVVSLYYGEKRYTVFTNNAGNDTPILFETTFSSVGGFFDKNLTFTYANTKYVDEQIASLRDLIGGIENGSY